MFAVCILDKHWLSDTIPDLKSWINQWKTWVINSLNSEKFQNFHFQAEIVIFRANHNDNQGEFRTFPNSPDLWYSKFFSKITIIRMPIFGKFIPRYIGWIRKNSGIHPYYHFFMIFPSKLTISAWKWKFWNFSEFSLDSVPVLDGPEGPGWLKIKFRAHIRKQMN